MHLFVVFMILEVGGKLWETKG